MIISTMELFLIFVVLVVGIVLNLRLLYLIMLIVRDRFRVQNLTRKQICHLVIYLFGLWYYGILRLLYGGLITSATLAAHAVGIWFQNVFQFTEAEFRSFVRQLVN